MGTISSMLATYGKDSSTWCWLGILGGYWSPWRLSLVGWEMQPSRYPPPPLPNHPAKTQLLQSWREAVGVQGDGSITPVGTATQPQPCIHCTAQQRVLHEQSPKMSQTALFSFSLTELP